MSNSDSTLIDNATFLKGIREDGTVEGYPIETYYRPCEGIGDDDGFLRVQIDDDATDIETRVPHSALIAAGWVKTQADHQEGCPSRFFIGRECTCDSAATPTVNAAFEMGGRLRERGEIQSTVRAAVSAERERCAKLCEAMPRMVGTLDGQTFYIATGQCAAAIRKEPT
jgi:hypothetical protein